MKLHDVAPDILPDAANEILITVKSAIRSRNGFIGKRVKELADIAGQSAIHGLLHAIEEKHVLHRLSAVGLSVEPITID